MRPFSHGVRLAKSVLPQSGTVRSHLPAFGPSYILSNDRHLFNYNCARRLLSNGTSGMTPDVAFSRYKELVDLAEKQKAEAERKEREKQQKVIDEIRTASSNNSSSSSSSSNNNKDRNAGVKVVRTIAKETKKAHVDKINLSISSTPAAASDDPLTYLQYAAESGHVESQIRYANHLLPKSPLEAMTYYEMSNSNEGWFNLGHVYWTGVEGAVAKDTEKAVECFKKAADNGDADSLYFLGVHQSSLSSIKLSASLGHSGALYYLALHNYGEDPTDLVRFKSELLSAAEASPEAMALVGESYFSGSDGFPKRHDEALEWWKKAAEAGDAEAAVSAGALLYHGSLPQVQKDRSAAFQYYQMAGELGSTDGWMNVAACYAEGEGVPKCEKTAKYIIETMVKKPVADDDDKT